MTTTVAPQTEPLLCKTCLKPEEICLCDSVRPTRSRLKILILQHPQEPDKLLGTSTLTALTLPENCVIRSGMSWANLSKAWGSEIRDPKRWGVLYLGSGINGPHIKQALTWVNKGSVALLEEEQAQISRSLEGIVFLDGTWSQAKTLWWRNAWLLKLRRGILETREKSLYGSLRKEPRSECLSTLESVAYTLEALGEKAEVKDALLSGFKAMLEKTKAAYPGELLAGRKTGARKFSRRPPRRAK